MSVTCAGNLSLALPPLYASTFPKSLQESLASRASILAGSTNLIPKCGRGSRRGCKLHAVEGWTDWPSESGACDSRHPARRRRSHRCRYSAGVDYDASSLIRSRSSIEYFSVQKTSLNYCWSKLFLSGRCHLVRGCAVCACGLLGWLLDLHICVCVLACVVRACCRAELVSTYTRVVRANFMLGRVVNFVGTNDCAFSSLHIHALLITTPSILIKHAV
jgi:hypothetical protein